MEFRMQRLESLNPDEFSELLEQSRTEGFRFVQRLVDDYESNRNRFDQPGEVLMLF